MKKFKCYNLGALADVLSTEILVQTVWKDFQKTTNKALYHRPTSFFSKIKKDMVKFVVCCSRDWRFLKGLNR